VNLSCETGGATLRSVGGVASVRPAGNSRSDTCQERAFTRSDGTRLRMREFLLSALCIIPLGWLGGCGKAAPRMEAPAWDADGFADAVMTKLDANGDGSLQQPELSSAPGLAWGAKYIDSNKDNALSREELNERFALYEKMRRGLISKQVQLSYKNRPLPGAKVKFVPEFFLDGVVEPAEGETMEDGVVDPQTQGLNVAGVRVGYYRVVIESPKVKIPPQFGSAETTTVGVEIPPYSNDPALDGTIKLAL
jgi:hypothetical protein